ncbi:hypothetical protein COT52_01840 [candidate division WWE3 bacterium CG08_land_8_20_14_0_20_43_13]|uniref:Uncharacterized protein n=1 Tax=candidate division WWE3 bacterium CG08_land_8_20_14_0_20_43_13 TaxID=1975087 RepID=A0A2H0X798_UNCKA|nr:MAG: hypothetical protein COT52_01840 [candidate division WWE3 bacterium CG08_land_8_20_14_0_20_43_13]
MYVCARAGAEPIPSNKSRAIVDAAAKKPAAFEQGAVERFFVLEFSRITILLLKGNVVGSLVSIAI